MKKNKRYFPCWVCKGKGGEKEIVTDDGYGPFYECGYCEGEGMIEIGGKVHRRIKAEQIGMMIIGFVKPEKYADGISFKELQELGKKALSLASQKPSEDRTV